MHHPRHHRSSAPAALVLLAALGACGGEPTGTGGRLHGFVVDGDALLVGQVLQTGWGAGRHVRDASEGLLDVRLIVDENGDGSLACDEQLQEVRTDPGGPTRFSYLAVGEDGAPPPPVSYVHVPYAPAPDAAPTLILCHRRALSGPVQVSGLAACCPGVDTLRLEPGWRGMLWSLTRPDGTLRLRVQANAPANHWQVVVGEAEPAGDAVHMRVANAAGVVEQERLLPLDTRGRLRVAELTEVLPAGRWVVFVVARPAGEPALAFVVDTGVERPAIVGEFLDGALTAVRGEPR